MSADIEWQPQQLMAHAPAGSISHLAILNVKTRIRETVEITRVIVMQMRQDHVGHLSGIDTDQRQRVRRIAQQVALAPRRRFLGESRIDPGTCNRFRRSTQTK